jgi:dTDP-4-dehydrorhamnose reductase
MKRVLINGAKGMLSAQAAQVLSQHHDVIVLGQQKNLTLSLVPDLVMQKPS